MPFRPFPSAASGSVGERYASGRAARGETPRSSHASFVPAQNRPDPIELLEEQAKRRTPDLVPIRYGRMVSSPFAFYRGGAAIMAADLATTPRSGIETQLCGDAHLSNFGGFMTPERTHVFGLNDFDETRTGPWEWDVKRLATSFEVAARDRGFGESQRDAAVIACLRAYTSAISQFAAMRNLDLWYLRLEADRAIATIARRSDPTYVRQAKADVAKSRSRDHLVALAKLTTRVDGKLRFRTKPPLVVRAKELLTAEQLHGYRATIDEFLAGYRLSLSDERAHLLDGYHFVDMARKVVGVGSVGTRCWMVLMVGNGDADPLILQLKEATTSVLAPYLGPTEFEHEGRRVVVGQRLMQAASDILLGWYRIKTFEGVERDFYVRQLWDGKFSANIDTISPAGLVGYAELCGWTLGRAHARSGDRVAIAGYLGRGRPFEEAVAAFARSYADQNERDWRSLMAAVGDGRIQAVTGV